MYGPLSLSTPAPFAISSSPPPLAIFKIASDGPELQPTPSLSKPLDCVDRGVQPIMLVAQAVDAAVVSNAVHRGSIGVRVYGNGSLLGYAAEEAAVDFIFHRLVRRAPCGWRTAGDAILTGASILNAANTEFRR
jgi:hypothetical protein